MALGRHGNFFLWGFITVLVDSLIPRLRDVFELSYFQAGLVQFAFFGAFFLLGMEYYITDNISLAGEYHFGFDYTAALTEVFDNGITTIETKGGSSMGLGITSSGLLTLAIYR